MRKTSPIRPLLLVLTASLLLAWWVWPSHSETTDTTLRGGDFSILANRIWIDHIPTDERDKIHVFLLFDDPSFGFFSNTSSFEGTWAAFEWHLEKGLVLSILQNQTTHKVRPKISSDGHCVPFDYCLKLDGDPKGPGRYGSMEDWVVNSGQGVSAQQALAQFVFPQ